MKTLLQKVSLVFLVSAYSISLYATESLDLSQYKGEKAVYIDFWASWCGPCRQSFPWLNKMHAQYAEQGLKIIAVNVDADRDEANEFLVDHPAKFEVIYDPEGGLAEKFNIQGMPGVVLITRSGEVFSQYIGFQNERVKHYEESIKKLLVAGETDK